MLPHIAFHYMKKWYFKVYQSRKKFVEVIHNSEKLFKRKTTLVWLFQENERISSDRLFRVREHQPFNSSGKIIMSQCDNSKLPTVKDSVCLGDICIFYFAKPA